MKHIIVLVQLNVTCLFCLAQTAVSPTITMRYVANNNVQFAATLRPLCQMAGAPKACYSYFWEFGDGTFSDVPFDSTPRHHYKTTNQPYNVLLSVTNTYDNCSTPLIKQQLFTINTIKGNTNENTKWNPGFFGTKDRNRNIKMKTDRDPKPGDNLIAYIGYRNPLGNNSSGSLLLFFNDKRFLRKSFRIMDKRTYNGEENTSSDPEGFNSRTGKAYPMLQMLKKNYMDHTVFRYNSLQKGEENFIFLTMQMLLGMAGEVDEVITFTAVLIPDDPALPPEKFEMLSKIVTSYDPNQMLLKESRINYRFMKRHKELNYKVQFQNLGEGPARNISVGIDLPKQLNPATIKIKEISPTSLSCDSVSYSQQSCVDTSMTADGIHFLIKNIYLPGLKEKLVKNVDSTKGFISYSIRFKKRPKKIPFSSRAVIVFDQNKPIYTNKSTARFIKGLSPGIVAGYNFSPSKGDYSAKGPLQIGYVLAPYAPSRPYFQLEIHAGILQHENSKEVIRPFDTSQVRRNFNLPTGVRIDTARISKNSKETILNKERNVLQVVPLHLRYNLNNWIGLGLGVMGQITISEQIILTEKYNVGLYSLSSFTGTSVVRRNFDSTLVRTDTSKTIGGAKMWKEAKVIPFFDIQIGRVRTGPTLGFRYYRQLQGNIRNRFFIYAGFKL